VNAMHTLITERLYVNNLKAEDWPALQKMVVEKEASAYAIYDYPWPTDEERIKKIAEDLSNGDSFMAVRLKKNDALIGYISLNETQPETYDLGFCFHPAYHHMGYATESCIAVIDYARDDLNARQIVSSTAAANIPACRLLDRLGMEQIGLSISSFRKSADGTPIQFIGLTFEKKLSRPPERSAEENI
jgi:RimJ/RimL family protein N-acetyltransferase